MRVRFIDMVLAAQTFVHEVRRCSCTIGATAVAVGRIEYGRCVGHFLSPATPASLGSSVRRFTKFQVSKYVVADGDDPMHDNVSVRMRRLHACEVFSKRRRAVSTMGCAECSRK
jgi:hypothetical protein